MLVAAKALDLPSTVAIAAGVAASLAIRTLALIFGLSLYRPAVPNQSGDGPCGKPGADWRIRQQTRRTSCCISVDCVKSGDTCMPKRLSGRVGDDLNW